MLEFFFGIILLYVFFWFFVISIGIIVLLFLINLIASIVSSVRAKKGDNNAHRETLVKWKPDEHAALYPSGSIRLDDIDPIDVDAEVLEDEEPFVCPECGDPYDGIFCENCGHSNDMPGNEEVSEDEKMLKDIVTIAMFDAEERRREEKELNLFDPDFEEYWDEFDD